MGKLSHTDLENKASGNTIVNSRKNKTIQGGKCNHSIQYSSIVYLHNHKYQMFHEKKNVTIMGRWKEKSIKAGLKLNVHLP